MMRSTAILRLLSLIPVHDVTSGVIRSNNFLKGKQYAGKTNGGTRSNAAAFKRAAKKRNNIRKHK